MALFAYLIFAAIPFGYRTILYTFGESFNEYATISLYARDALLVLLIIFGMKRLWSARKLKWNEGRHVWLSLILGTCALVSVFFANEKALALYNSLRLLMLIGSALVIAGLLREKVIKLEKICAVFAGGAVIQACIGLYQFLFQQNLGVWFLGESFLSSGIDDIAKVTVYGGKLIRAYGTFPHPNILSAFLVIGLVSFIYLWFVTPRKSLTKEIAISGGLFITTLGIVLTFSRAAWVVATAAFFFITIIMLSESRRREKAINLLAIMITVAFVFGFFFSPLIFERSSLSFFESSVNQRLLYNEIGLEIIEKNIWGVGIGNQVLYSINERTYENLGMPEKMWQPVHNIYLLIGAELGILGLIIFLRLIVDIIWRSKGKGSLLFIPTTMMLALLFFGIADHFLWTLEPGRLMFWLVTGIIMGAPLEEKLVLEEKAA